jgi:hypothetical protein
MRENQPIKHVQQGEDEREGRRGQHDLGRAAVA